MVTTNLNNPNLVTDIINDIVDSEQSFRSSPDLTDEDFSTSVGQNADDVTSPISSVTLQIPNVEITDENRESVKETIRQYVAAETGLDPEDITVTVNDDGSVTITARENSVDGTSDSPIGLNDLVTNSGGSLASDIQDTILESDDVFEGDNGLSDVAPTSTTPTVSQNTLKEATFTINPINTDNIDTEFIKERLRNKFVSDGISGEYDIEVTVSAYGSEGANITVRKRGKNIKILA